MSQRLEVPNLGAVEVTVQTMDGTCFGVTLQQERRYSCVRALRVQIEEKAGIPHYTQELFLLDDASAEGTPLHDDFEIKCDCTVALSIIPPRDVISLVELRESTNYEDWNRRDKPGWDRLVTTMTPQEAAACQPSGVTLDSDGHVIEICLGNCGLKGTLPSFERCTALTVLLLHSNRLIGTIPSFERCTALLYLDLHNNQFTDSGTWKVNSGNYPRNCLVYV